MITEEIRFALNHPSMIFKNECLVVAKEIADNLLKDTQFKNNGLLSGKMGAIIYLYMCYEYWGVEEYKFLADKWMVEVLNDSDEHLEASFCEGNTGIAWGLEFLNKEAFVNADIDYLLSDFDDYLTASIETDLSIPNSDFLYGFIGKGLYFLDKNSMNEVVTKTIIDHLDINAYKLNEETLAWASKRYQEAEKFDLGLAHGNLALMSFLLKCRKADRFDNGLIDRILRKSVNFFRFIRNRNSTSNFPSWMTVDNSQKSEKSRLAWCYGDLGVAYVFLEIGFLLEDSELIEEAIELCKVTAKRKSVDETGVEDAYICHGSSGLTLMYHLIYRKTKISLFKDASDYWMEKTINTYYNSIRSNLLNQKNQGQFNEFDLLTGISGIGLAILTYTDSSTKEWYKSLLL